MENILNMPTQTAPPIKKNVFSYFLCFVYLNISTPVKSEYNI